MKNNRAPIRYAKALLNLGMENKQAAELNNHMKLVASTISENEELRHVINSPVIKSEAKLSILKDVFGTHVDALTLGLFNVLLENKRLSILESVAVQYSVLYDYVNAVDKAVVTTAVPLTADLKTKVLSKVKELTGKEATIENIVDEKILGGFVLRIGDLRYDASISSQLESLRREFDTDDFVAKI